MGGREFKGPGRDQMVQGPEVHGKKDTKGSHWRVLQKRDGVCAADIVREGRQVSAAPPESKPALAS